MMISLFSILLFVLPLFQAVSPDDVDAAIQLLQKKRAEVMSAASTAPADKARSLMELGDWDAARSVLEKAEQDDEIRVQWAWYWYRQNNFNEAEASLRGLSGAEAAWDVDVQALNALLYMQTWRLDEAIEVCDRFWEQATHPKMLYLKGRVFFLQKKFDQALAVAKQLQTDYPTFAGGYLMEGDYLIWQQKPAESEALLRRALELDPFDADARFLYGYAIWRRVDATQLPDMAAQWGLALEIDPLHYLTHWHWGNGHTHLTYRDYAQPDDAEVREKLESAETLFVANRIDEAVDKTRQVQREHPGSVLPWLYRGSYFYSAFDREPEARLDSARRIFEHILEVKPHYGPAHNGLASVIRAQRIPYLADYGSLMAELESTEITDEAFFVSIFPDMDYYPGQIVKKMAWTQLHTATAYLPLLHRLGRSFVIPPLHKDLTIAMNSPFFRQSTTFDNRQWMDIRGVGSGAAAIEYVQKAAFLDRNVLLHEFVHLYHGTVLTDYQVRRIRQLYYSAVSEGRTLDYYAANNESEYFAQVYPAYYSPKKIHPLDFKSTNTRDDLMAKDPAAFAFMDSLVAAEKAALAGDRSAMAGNWAQAYLQLSRQARRGEEATARAMLDSSLAWQADYVPTMIAYGELELRAGNRGGAEAWFKKAEAIHPNHAPLYVSYARLAATNPNAEAALADQRRFLEKAYALETDVQEEAGMARNLYNFHLGNGDVREAVSVAEQYASSGSALSTYLRDRLDDASAFAASLRAGLGDAAAVETLAELVRQKPQNYGYRKLYADALAGKGSFADATATLEESQAILKAAGTPRSDFTLKMADYANRAGDKTAAASLLGEVEAFRPTDFMDAMLKLRLTADLVSVDEAQKLLAATGTSNSGFEKAEWAYTKAVLGNGQPDVELLKEALELNPYHMAAYEALTATLRAQGQTAEAERWADKMKQMRDIR